MIEIIMKKSNQIIVYADDIPMAVKYRINNMVRRNIKENRQHVCSKGKKINRKTKYIRMNRKDVLQCLTEYWLRERDVILEG